MEDHRPWLRDDLEVVLTTLDRAPHTREELSDVTGIPKENMEPRIETLRDRGWISEWAGEETVFAMTWLGRYRLHTTRFRAAAAAAVGLGLLAAAGIGAWATGSRPSPASPGWGSEVVGFAAAGAVLLVVAEALRRWAPGRAGD